MSDEPNEPELALWVLHEAAFADDPFGLRKLERTRPERDAERERRRAAIIRDDPELAARLGLKPIKQ